MGIICSYTYQCAENREFVLFCSWKSGYASFQTTKTGTTTSRSRAKCNQSYQFGQEAKKNHPCFH